MKIHGKFKINMKKNKIKFLTITFVSLINLTNIVVFSKDNSSNSMGKKHSLGIIKIKGNIDEKLADYIDKQIKKAYNNKNLYIIILDCDSPGGGSISTSHIISELKDYRKKYPSITFISWIPNLCASACYWIISTTTDKIISMPLAIVGSIGAFGEDLTINNPVSISQNSEKYLAEYSVITDAKYKKTEYIKMNPEIEKYLKDDIQVHYKHFINSVAEGRPQLNINKTNEWAEGQVFPGFKAQKLGLVDQIGSWSTVIDAAITLLAEKNITVKKEDLNIKEFDN